MSTATGRVAIIGAGIAGLAAGRRLRESGVDAVIFEKSRGPGGRCATRRQDGFIWDTGATSILPRGKRLERVMLEQLPTDDLVEITKPVFVHHNLRVSPGDSSRGGRRWAYQSGINRLAHLLAEGLEIRPKVSITEIGRSGSQYIINEEAFDRLVITVPTPQASLLLWSLAESRPIANVRYRPCLSVCLGFEAPLPDLPYFAVLDPTQQHPMVWLSAESVKCPLRKSSVVIQINREYSRRWFDRAEDEIIETAVQYVTHLWGEAYATPIATDTMRWKYAQPEALARFDLVNPPGSTLVLAGDALWGGHVEDAFESGCLAAEVLLS
jgi:predicted NAD/FAD-dependent oxidoreductase